MIDGAVTCPATAAAAATALLTLPSAGTAAAALVPPLLLPLLPLLPPLCVQLLTVPATQLAGWLVEPCPHVELPLQAANDHNSEHT
jgi:hypothetical protein